MLKSNKTMSANYIHVDQQIDIMKRFPVKSLIRFRTVSKPWKSLIDSFEFMVDYSKHQQKHQPLLLIRYKDQSHHKYVSLLDDNDCFHKHELFTPPPPPMSVKVNLEDSYNYLVGSSHGLFCFIVHDYNDYDDDDDDDDDYDGDDDYYYEEYDFCNPVMAVIWNPSIRKSLTIKVPDKYNYAYGGIVYGFGVLPITFDPMILKIARMTKLGEVVEHGYWRIYIFTLSSGAWKYLRGAHLPGDYIMFTDSHVAINGFIFLHATNNVPLSLYGPFEATNVIISFGMTSHDFRELYLPTSLAKQYQSNLSVSKLNESLVVLEYNDEEVGDRQVCVVWMMMDDRGVPNSFAKLYTIRPADASVERVLGFTNSGAPIIQMKNDDDKDSSTISVFETDSQHMREIGIYQVNHSFHVNSYMETLLLLNWPDSMERRYLSNC